MELLQAHPELAGEYPEEPSSTPVYRPWRCMWNAVYNQQCAYKGMGLRIVCGSVSVDDHFCFGGSEKWTAKEAFSPTDGGMDAHVWLEDKDGNVYDKWFYEYLNGTHPKGKKPIPETIFKGKSKKDIAAKWRIRYFPMERKETTLLMRSIFYKTAIRGKVVVSLPTIAAIADAVC
jgi:hypothetical protein